MYVHRGNFVVVFPQIYVFFPFSPIKDSARSCRSALAYPPGGNPVQRFSEAAWVFFKGNWQPGLAKNPLPE
jgi:hypothetical protein